MNSIKSLSKLLETLTNCDPEDYVKMVANMKLPKEDFGKYAFWKPEGYTRNCIERTSVFELILICWVYQVDGVIDEIRFNEDDAGKLQESHHTELLPHRLSYMEDRMGYHSLENRSGEKAMTLHLYISPIDYCKVYNTCEEKFDVKELRYDSYKGVLTDEFISQ